MNYEETLKYINDTPKFSKILGNGDLEKLLASLGNPQDKLEFIHIAGTNGKGSCASLIASALSASGKKVGLFTSPYIEEFNERIRVNGENIPDDELCSVATLVREKTAELSLEISVFAQVSAMAFLYFEKEKCDIVVLEAGLGGRLDATNVIKSPLCAIITKIGLDHTEWLGETIEEITAEKCGIIKSGVPVFTTENQTEEALGVIKEYAKKSASSLFISPESDIKTSLSGEFQKENAGICEAVLTHLGTKKTAIEQGFLSCRHIARFEFLRDNLVIDGAHNPDGVDALITSLKKTGRDVVFVCAMMEDKAIGDIARKIDELAKSVILTEIDMPRCAKCEDLAGFFADAILIKNPVEAVRYALSVAKNDELVCVCGSLYLLGEVRSHFKNPLHQ